MITIDCGDLSDHLYSPENLTGTIKCFSKHKLKTQVFENIGEQDVTSDVNFSALIYYGQEFGLENLVFTRQADFFN
ncbi:MAG: SAM-dependent methyltransferase [Blastocatellia bacterium]|nr:SAM-dependent methyltransferase [Blastocatellia bacterium]